VPSFPEPRQCIFWRDEERVRGPVDPRFELVAQYADESHFQRYLLKCRECGQLYFFEFQEEIDWSHGKDPQFTTYIPVSSIEQATALADITPEALLEVSPRLCIDFPKDAENSTVYWIRDAEITAGSSCEE
jgi:hypothetical protein